MKLTRIIGRDDKINFQIVQENTILILKTATAKEEVTSRYDLKLLSYQ